MSGIGTWNVPRDALISDICKVSEPVGLTTWTSRFHGPDPFNHINNPRSKHVRKTHL